MNKIEQAGTDLETKVAELIQDTYYESGLTRDTVAHRLFVDPTRISQYVNGFGNFKLATVGRLFAAMGFDVEIVLHPRKDE